MDICSLKPSERVIELLHPKTEEPIGVRVSIVSATDERTKKAKRRFLDEKLNLESRGKHLTSEKIEEINVSLLYSAMVSWEWYGEDITLNGEKNPVFNQKNVYFFLNSCPLFAAQIEKEVSDEKAFF